MVSLSEGPLPRITTEPPGLAHRGGRGTGRERTAAFKRLLADRDAAVKKSETFIVVNVIAEIADDRHRREAKPADKIRPVDHAVAGDGSAQ